MSPEGGSYNGGNYITITGRDFFDVDLGGGSDDLKCRFGSDDPGATNIVTAQFISTTQVRCQVPPALPNQTFVDQKIIKTSREMYAR